MNNEINSNKNFSIFNPAIRYEHREFYERIVSELNGIFPVCNQGESTAVEISETPTEQEQITELMKRVENFSQQLLKVTKKLFDQYYVAKEALYKSILSTTAYNKINTLDRNLLERTCDVRWWALETAFSDCIILVDQCAEEAGTIAKHVREAEREVQEGEAVDDLAEDASLVKKVLHEMDKETDGPEDIEATPATDELSVILDHLLNFPLLLNYKKLDTFVELFETVLNKLTFRNGTGKDECIKFAKNLKTLNEKIVFACDRLEDINNSYTLYRDLLITDRDGNIIANSNKKRRQRILGLSVKEEEWFQKACKTKNGTEYIAQDLNHSVAENRLSLVYSTAVRENSDENGKPIGTMGVFFDFQGEAQIILEEYMPHDERGLILDGCYSMFTNEKGQIIGSNDEAILRVGDYAQIPRVNRNLSDGGKTSSYLVFLGVDSAVFSAKTDGYLDYKGLGWSSHVIIPKEQIFEMQVSSDNISISAEDLMDSRIIPEINKQTYLKVQDDKESIQLISLNGIVFASKLGKRGGALGPIFNQITKSGDFVTSKMEDLLKEMAVGELELNLKALENFSKQAIDLIDRNLFERSADIRWWATDQYFWEALMTPSDKNYQKASERLKVINGSYTMYRNLILTNASGEIVACSRNELWNELKKINVSDQIWFQHGMRTTASNEYAVQDVMHSNLEKLKQRSLIYSGGVRKNGKREGDSIGVLGILFDWDTEAKKILEICIPRHTDGKSIEGSAAFYTNRSNEIIETTDEEHFPVGLKLEFPESILSLSAGDTVSSLFTYKDMRYIIGSSKTKGYREYSGLDWAAHVIRPIY